MRKVSIVILVLMISACSVSPWVKPYEREKLADNVMSFDRNPVDTQFMGHAFGNREAAIGAEGTGGGGCGCN